MSVADESYRCCSGMDCEELHTMEGGLECKGECCTVLFTKFVCMCSVCTVVYKVVSDGATLTRKGRTWAPCV